MLDRGGFGQGCSHANCGLVVPSHVLPLGDARHHRPDAANDVPQKLPLDHQARFELGLVSLAVPIRRPLQTSADVGSRPREAALLNASVDLYKELIEKESLDCEWQTEGVLFVFQSKEGMEHFARTDALLREQFDMGAKRLDGEELIEREPALKPGLAGAWFYERDCHLRPDRLLDRVAAGAGRSRA